MKSIHVLILSVVTAFSLSACGRGKLTDEQKAILRSDTESMGRAEKASKQYQAQVPVQAYADFSPSSSQSARPDEGMMSDYLRSAHCDFKMDHFDNNDWMKAPPGSAPARQRIGFGLNMTGASCPANLVMNNDMVLDFSNPSDIRISWDFSVDYKVQDERYRRMNDVDFMKMAGGMKGGGSSNQVEAKIEVRGSAHSQSHGDIGIFVHGNMKGNQQGKGEAVVEFEFKYEKFTAVLKQETRDQKNKYFINDEEVSSQEFSTYMSNMGSLSSGVGTGAAS